MNSGIYEIESTLVRESLRDEHTCEYFSALKARTTYSEVYWGMWISIHQNDTLIHTSDEFAT